MQKKLIARRAAFVLFVSLSLAFSLSACSDAKEQISDLRYIGEGVQTYLTELGWESDAEPLEVLTLQLPNDLDDTYADYCKLQQKQHFPFVQYAGKQVKRYTYAVHNYPDIADGVQANIYLYNGYLIGGDLISLGENSFQQALDFPKQAKKERS